MLGRNSSVRFVLASAAAWLSACTTDFAGYHLRSDPTADAGDSGTSGGKGALHSGGDGSSNLGEAGANEAGAGENGGSGAVATGMGGATGDGAAGSTGGDLPTVATPSCEGLASNCGAKQSASCCESSPVLGGSYARSAQAGDHTSVSDFMLDDYEVTVGRFRNFMSAFTQDMIAAGSGKNPHNAADPGWDTAWNAKLPTTSAAFAAALGCPGATFSANAGDGENEPVTCVNWYEAYAFCIWDGGRLPSEAEWNYAAAGGPEERKYPWGNSAPTDSQAVFCPGSCSTLQNVGVKSAGAGKWGQVDLVGNAWEWNLDVFAKPFAQASCTDCAYTNAAASTLRAFRGGSAGNDASYLLVADRNSREAGDHNGFIGLRCARDR